VIDAGGNVLEGGRPATAAAPAQAPVLEIPARPPPPGEVGDQVVLEAPVVARAPKPAVNEDGNRVRRSTVRGQRELTELVAVRPIRVRAGGDGPKLHSHPLPGA